jgi:hypothetical protein
MKKTIIIALALSLAFNGFAQKFEELGKTPQMG